MLRAAIGVLALIAAFVFAAEALRAAGPKASFDCVQKPDPLDHLVCKTPELARLNEDMAAAYRTALEVIPNIELLRFQQDVWMLSLEDACPAAPTSEICISERFKFRLGQLAEYLATKLHKCNSLRTDLAKLVCEEPRLVALTRQIEQRAETLISAEKDPMHARQIRQDQEDWWVNKTASLYSAAPCPEKYRNSCIERQAQNLNDRLAQLDLVNPTKNFPNTLPFAPPDNWWGVDISNLMPDKSPALETILSGPNRSLILAIDTNHGAERHFIDAVSGKTVATSKDDRSLLTHPANAGSIYAKYGFMKLDRSYGGIAFPSGLKLAPYNDSCDGPLNGFLAYTAEGRGMLGASSRYLVRRLPASKTFVETVRCEEIGEVSWDAAFVSVQPQEIFRLSDGTILVQFYERHEKRDYLVRFRPDLTSPFFYGQSDLLLLSRLQTAFLPALGLENLMGKEQVSNEYFAAIALLLDRTAQEQTTAKRAR